MQKKIKPFFREHFGEWNNLPSADKTVLTVSAIVGAGFIAGETTFAKIGIPLPLGSPDPLAPKPALYVFELYLAFLGTMTLLALWQKRTSLKVLFQPLSGLAIFLLVLGTARAAVDLRQAPLLVIRNAAFAWYLALPILILVYPIQASAWNLLFRVFLAVPVFTVTFSVFFPWFADPAHAPLGATFAEYVRPNWAVSTGIYGAFFWALTLAAPIWSAVVNAAIGATLGLELATSLTRTNLLGLLAALGFAGVFTFYLRRGSKKIFFGGLSILAVALCAHLYLLKAPKSTATLLEKKYSSNPFIKSEMNQVGMEKFRYYAWSDAWNLFLTKPLLGIGFKEQVVYRYYNGGEFRPNDGYHLHPRRQPISGPHNSYLNAISRMGIVGLGFLALHLLAFALLIQRRLYATACILAGGMLYASFNVALEGPGRSAVLLMALGVGLSAVREKSKLFPRNPERA